MRFLIYGFGPYRSFKTNISEKILRRLPTRPWLTKVVFPVRFHKQQFIRAVKRSRPDVVLGLGQCSGGNRLRVESRAINTRQNAKTEKPRAILTGGKRTLATKLRLHLGASARPSRDAGTYVCNYSMYVILELIERGRLPIRFGFVHIPHDHDVRKACQALQKAIDRARVSNDRKFRLHGADSTDRIKG